ncbi:thiolase family protein [Rhodococcus koreensis]|uniref:thiolase family protein n=1 Tax=Rhodococcus koreensis TaxID=99653 RepID=UPI003672C03C
MHYKNVAIPLGHVWSSPFSRWQGTLANVSSLDLAWQVTNRALGERGIDPTELAGLVLGITIPQATSFFGAPTVAAQIGAPGISGPMVNQACATAASALHSAAATVATGGGTQLVVTTDRTSNGPNIIYPAPSAAGGSPTVENMVQQNFAHDPWAGTSMLEAAELVARKSDIRRAELDDVALLRYSQYERALADDRRFQRRYMTPVHIRSGRTVVSLDADEGVRPVDRDSVSTLRPASAQGMHTGATQTHPADGTAGALVTTTAAARERSGGRGVVEILSTGFARVARSHMPEAPVPAAFEALKDAGLSIGEVDAITTHNPFAVNDVYFSRKTGVSLEKMNNYGCSLIWGHPQAPTGMRSVAELIEELTLRGGGTGLFTGCAAGDSAGAVVIRVTD